MIDGINKAQYNTLRKPSYQWTTFCFGVCKILTLRQVDNVVQANLFVIKDWEHERQEQGSTILYTVWSNAISPKLYLGVFRVWEWLDGSGRCGWQPLPETSPGQEKLRRFFHMEMVMPILVKANNTTIDPSAAQVDAAKPEKALEDTTGWDLTLIEMWNKGHSRDEIANQVSVSKDRVTNRVTELRNKFGESIVPYNKDRKRRLIKS